MTWQQQGATAARVSYDTAAAITRRSKRTWQRRVTDGLAARLPNDGMRPVVLLSDVLPLVEMELTAADAGYLVLADTGDAAAQADMGEFFRAAGRLDVAHYWFNLAAAQDDPEAMQCLAQCYASGEGVEQNSNLALMWLAKAADKGHVIAREQLKHVRFGPSA